MAANPIQPHVFRFLEELDQNNDREWFHAHQERFEAQVREPMRAFVRTMEPALFRISEHVVADDRKSGGSLIRIQRDIRFSHDKRPYKRNVGLHFGRRGAGREIHAPGYYLHLEPGDCFAGAGVWLPDATSLRAIRQAIVAHSKDWASATALGKKWVLSRDQALKRPPLGFDADHPHIEDLKLKSFTLFRKLDEKSCCAKNFPSNLATAFDEAAPFMKFLCEALELEW